MSTEDTLHQASFVILSHLQSGTENVVRLDVALAAVAAANARWESALGAVMPADFKCWHQNAKSELPEIAAGVIENLRQQAADAWEQGAAAVAAERERCAKLADEYSTWGGSNFYAWFQKLAADIRRA